MMGQTMSVAPPAMHDDNGLLPVLDWHSLDSHSPLYPYFAHVYFGGADLFLSKTDVTAFVGAFSDQVAYEDKEMDAFDVDAGFEALASESGRPGYVRLLTLIEELGLLVGD
ncbi:hypothetical protein SPRG_13472 [Saprolegnia parasitica CBS 223.65]|uniref:Uncharacterized protein n=1 Tax=Saprolegnia parasitica (strain CBS 223.65) TaxID=695850 RepID=A0A067C0A1_SAPPC|nr:hypothetical protein SPRG_13472 [Saprolegnia parasitica CBS 223.65]KDO20217.1 hypothetical protein SPRG_13472 [Saprolegnia parasitica CBS 223.65]|eukprot:XP_012209104.1 hypothetical protein SPRG_13472 [Saprolegnia parasitica CBS 223.65]